jgi:hypothetical protein
MLLHEYRFRGANLTHDDGAFLDRGRADDSDAGRRDLADADVAGLDLRFFVDDLTFGGGFADVFTDDLAPDGNFTDVFADDLPSLRLDVSRDYRLRAGARERLGRWRRSARCLRRWGGVAIVGLGFRLDLDDFPTYHATPDDALDRLLDDPFHDARFRRRNEQDSPALVAKTAGRRVRHERQKAQDDEQQGRYLGKLAKVRTV